MPSLALTSDHALPIELDGQPETPPKTLLSLEDRPIDESLNLKVAVIGAGISGINAGILLPIKVPGIRLTILEKNADIGGTWFENAYPGVRCDIPAHVYQSTYEPNVAWTEEYAQGAEIRDYWQRIVRKYGVYERLRFRTKVTAARWVEEISQWRLNLESLDKSGAITGESEYSEDFDVVIAAIGRFNAWRLPDYPGIDIYSGHLRHASNWDREFDPQGKTVAVIGNGASGIQVVGSISKIVGRLDHYARNPTWIAGSFAGEGEGRKLEPIYYSAETLKSLEDPDNYLEFRRSLEAKFYGRFEAILKGSAANEKLRDEFKTAMAGRLKDKPELLEHLLPDFAPNCRRLTPGPGYLEALTQANVDYIRTPIANFTENGIVTTDGKERKVDAVICCTGANTDMIPPFPITVPRSGEEGAAALSLRDAWTPDPYTYLGVATPSFPNLLFIQGPNGTGFSGTTLTQTETQTTYIAQLLRKVSQQHIKTFVPSKAAADDFLAYCDAFFAQTVFTEKCSSWAKSGRRPDARIHGHWPGSASHLNFVRRNPRWEDWDWTYRSTSGNRFAYFGNGRTVRESPVDQGRSNGVGHHGSNGAVGVEPPKDPVKYLRRPDAIDLRVYHEEWFDL